MMRYRLFYFFVLICMIFFYAAYPFWLSWYLLVLVLLFPLFDLLMSLPGMLSRRVSLAAPPILEQGKTAVLTISITAEKAFPAGRIKARFRDSNEDRSVWRQFKCGGTRGSQYKWEIDASHSGVTVFELSRIWVCSVMGLFSAPVSVKCRIGVLVMPAPVKPPNTVSLPRGTLLRPKPGGGFSEEHDIRPYRPGDPMNSIHWKLSAKHDTPIIREALVPPPHSRLVRCTAWATAEERDIILGRLRWISAYLLDRGCPYYVQLGDKPLTLEIARPEDLANFLYRALDNRAVPASASLPAHFTWVFQIDASVLAGL